MAVTTPRGVAAGDVDPRPPRVARRLVALGTLLTLAGVAGYFVVVLRFGGRWPGIVAHALPNQLLVAAGIVLAATAAWRGRTGVRIVAAANLLLGGAFVWFLHGGTAVAPVPGPAVGAPAPLFALRDHRGQPVRSDDFRGAPLVLVFYRGHW